MAKLTTPFTVVSCPVCGRRIDWRLDESALVRHIGDKHPSTSTKQLIRALFHELNLSLPENIDEVSGNELDELLTNLCLYKALKLGLKELRRKMKGR